MAHMIPDLPPAPGPGRHAERVLYDALRAHLPDEYFVYHGLHYLEHQRAEEGEVDFLLVHRERGLLALECKGKGVRRTSAGRWVRETSDGREAAMESPFRQAQRQIKALVKELQTRMDHRDRGRRARVLCERALRANSCTRRSQPSKGSSPT